MFFGDDEQNAEKQPTRSLAGPLAQEGYAASEMVAPARGSTRPLLAFGATWCRMYAAVLRATWPKYPLSASGASSHVSDRSVHSAQLHGAYVPAFRHVYVHVYPVHAHAQVACDLRHGMAAPTCISHTPRSRAVAQISTVGGKNPDSTNDGHEGRGVDKW